MKTPKEEVLYKKRKPRVSGKEGAKDVPQWAKGARPKRGETGNAFAKRLLGEKYGPGTYPKDQARNSARSGSGMTGRSSKGQTAGLVFVLWHVHEVPGQEDDEKLIGVYRSESDAKLAISRLECKPGFRESPEGFQIDAYKLSEDHLDGGLRDAASQFVHVPLRK